MITPFGYRRLKTKDRQLKFEHVLVWESVHGSVPEGQEIHHVNGDKLDNRIENLQLLTRLDHKRIHSGCVKRDGTWWKKCRICGKWKPVDEKHFYIYPGRNGVMGACKPCQIHRSTENKQRRRQAARDGVGQGEG